MVTRGRRAYSTGSVQFSETFRTSSHQSAIKLSIRLDKSSRTLKTEKLTLLPGVSSKVKRSSSQRL